MTPEQITEARRLLDASTADIPGDATDEEVDRLVHERTVAERTFMARMAPALIAEVERLQDEVANEARANEWAQKLTHQSCPKGEHPDWWIDSEYSHQCPGCRITELKAELDAVEVTA